MKTVLIVEDNMLNMKVLHDLLKSYGYGVIETGEGTEAMRLTRERRPDLILLDIQLPDVSGLQVAQWLKQDAELRAIPVIAVTAFAMRGDEEKILESGCDAYISKPISMRQLIDTVHKFLG